MASGKDRMSFDVADVEHFFVPEVAERLKAVGLADINMVDRFIGWLFSNESLTEIGLKRTALRYLHEAGIESAGEFVVRMMKQKERRRYIR